MAAERDVRLERVCNGVWKAPGARIIDRSGERRMPIGRADFATAMRDSVLVDKTMLIADVLDSGYAATLFCRPRRFGKTLNMTMLKAFLEASEAGGLTREEAEGLFQGTEAWDVSDGRYRQYQGAYPVVHLSLSTTDRPSWEDCQGAIRQLIQTEFSRHGYLEASERVLGTDASLYRRVVSGSASESDYVASLAALCRMLRAHHGVPVVLLIDEYDAPVMAAHSHGYYDEAVSFMRAWLVGAVKDGGTALAFACLTGVQHISKESIFSGLNNLYVSTPLGDDFDERYGFTEAEVAALATYMGHPECLPEAHEWYDGYRFGRNDVYNPWSVINYLNKGCTPGAYWSNTSGNAVVGELVAGANPETMEDVYDLLRPDGVVLEPLDLSIVFPELGAQDEAIWSMLYLAGYLTTDDVEMPSDGTRLRALRVPNREVGGVFRGEVIRCFRALAGGPRRLLSLHRALVSGDEVAFDHDLSQIVLRASHHDLTSELPCHMLLMGLLYGVPDYEDPLSNREEGYGRYDIRMEPDSKIPRHHPLVTVEVKFLREEDRPGDHDALDARLHGLAREGLAQIAEKAYDAELSPGAEGRLRWGVAFAGKRVAVACERA